MIGFQTGMTEMSPGFSDNQWNEHVACPSTTTWYAWFCLLATQKCWHDLGMLAACSIETWLHRIWQIGQKARIPGCKENILWCWLWTFSFYRACAVASGCYLSTAFRTFRSVAPCKRNGITRKNPAKYTVVLHPQTWMELCGRLIN